MAYPNPAPANLPDEQASADTRAIPINKVGIKDILHPIRFVDRSGEAQSTVAQITMTVNLPPSVKGTHMSRFVEILEDQDKAISLQSVHALLQTMTSRLNAEQGYIELNFPFFMPKTAPVSRVRSYLDYQVRLHGHLDQNRSRLEVSVTVPVTSLCPCSKSISNYGAHNQRSHITLTASMVKPVWVEELIEMAEKSASCELYGLLKRGDEKYVTERAYDNPKFVEDMVRDIAMQLNEDDRIRTYRVESENFESIHNHSAYACIEKDKSRDVVMRRDNITYLAMSQMQSATMARNYEDD